MNEPLSTGVEILFPAAKILHNLNAILFDPLNHETVNSVIYDLTGLQNIEEYLNNKHSM